MAGWRPALSVYIYITETCCCMSMLSALVYAVDFFYGNNQERVYPVVK